jgi:hypothetical protein
MARRPSQHESTAHHEAGHVVVAHALGYRSDHSTIEATESYTGFAFRRMPQVFPGIGEFTDDGRPKDNAPLADQLTILYAGVVAHRLLCTKREVSSKRVRLGLDIRQAKDKVRSYSKAERNELLTSALKRAMELLGDPENWQKVERIAAKLLEHGHLDGFSLEMLLDESLFA